MNFLRQIEKIDEIIEAKKEEEYQKTLFDTTMLSGGLGFSGMYSVNGQPFHIMGSNGLYTVNGESVSIMGSGGLQTIITNGETFNITGGGF